MNTDWLDVLAQYGLFCVYTRKPDMDQRTADAMYRQIVHSRIGSVAVPVLLLDWEHDIKYLNIYLFRYRFLFFYKRGSQEVCSIK